MRGWTISLLLLVIGYNAHQLVGLFVPGLGNVLWHQSYGDGLHGYLIDQEELSGNMVQRMGINLSMGAVMVIMAWCYVRKARTHAVLMAIWFMWQAWQVIFTCNCTVAEHVDWLILVVLLLTAWAWNRWALPPLMRIVAWNQDPE